MSFSLILAVVTRNKSVPFSNQRIIKGRPVSFTLLSVGLDTNGKEHPYG